jgi:maltooligosyltrehalose trehalohydrolase
MGAAARKRRFAVGAEVQGDGPTDLRVWAPRRRAVTVAIEGGGSVSLEPEESGYFRARVPGLTAGMRYRFRVDGESPLYADPASRFQPEGPEGVSEVVDPSTFAWTDAGWPGLAPRGQVLYELHVGTFTAEGTFTAAAARLPALRELGVTVVELMPIADFAGRFGWGYDGVCLWAPTRLYGRPDDLRRLVDGAHALGLGVILDVVYNHLGPIGNNLKSFSPYYFTDRYRNEWGEAINFDGEEAVPSRELFVENAGYWIEEYHFDGLRLDATQQMFDASREHVLAAISHRVREAGRGRSTYLVAENEPQDSRLVRARGSGGYGLDALWNDDFHHTARVALTGHNEAYYTDYRGTPQELLSAVRWGFLYQGQRYKWQKKPRGTPALDLPPEAFVNYLENHDQVSNSQAGARLATVTAPGDLRALTALLLLAPGTPLLFQGQEWGSTRPFLYFADSGDELGPAVRKGREEFLAQFPSLADPAVRARIPDPQRPETFQRCKLDWSERDGQVSTWTMHRDLLRLRRDDPAVSAQRADRIATAVLGDQALLLRYLAPAGDRVLVINLGRDLQMDVAPEPLLAPPAGARWRLLWSSEDVRYGGGGISPVETEEGLRFPGRAAVLLAPEASAA